MPNKVVLSLTLGAMALLSGCSSMLNTADSSEFGCPGMPMGVKCKSPMEVYKDIDRETGASGGVPVIAGQQPVAGRVATRETPKVKDPVADVVAKQLGTDARRTQPVREPAKVMRIWIAQWVEAGTDDLHWPSYIYTEIVPRKWSYGLPEAGVVKAPLPMPTVAAPIPGTAQAQSAKAAETVDADPEIN